MLFEQLESRYVMAADFIFACQDTPPQLALNQSDALFAQYDQEMLEYAKKHGEKIISLLAQGDALAASQPGWNTYYDQALAATYYDAIGVYEQIAEYTNDYAAWDKYIDAAVRAYRDNYVLRNNGGVPGFWNFTSGLARHYQRTGDPTSKEAIILLSKNAAYAADGVPSEWTSDQAKSREVAYAINSYLDAELAGEAPRERTSMLFEQALGHIDQWLNGNLQEVFMAGLTASALIRYWGEVSEDSRILTKLEQLADYIWENTWVDSDQSFKYHYVSSTAGAPDLNQLLTPMYAWLHTETGEQRHFDRAVMSLNGGVNGAYLDGAKQFNQSYMESDKIRGWLGEIGTTPEPNPSPNIRTIDNGDAGFTTVGNWIRSVDQGYQSDVHYASPGDGSNEARWTFSGLEAGIYQVSITWSKHTNRATNAPFSILDGDTVVYSTSVNQEQSPTADKTESGVAFQNLGSPVQITNGTLVVVLNNNANEYVIADAVMVEKQVPSPNPNPTPEQQRIAELEQQVADLLAQIQVYQERIAQLEDENTKLKVKVDRLEYKINLITSIVINQLIPALEEPV